MIGKREHGIVPWGLALLLGAAAPALAQEALPGVFNEVLEVRVVNIEVVVTDRDGIPVTGLDAADFRLLVDGEETPIEYFTEVFGGQARVAGKAGEGGGPRGVPALVPGEPVSTSYLVFIDEFFALDRDRDRVLDEIIAELPNLGPEDRMAVVAYDGKKLEMLSSWTGSQSELERVFRRAQGRPTSGLQRLSEFRVLQADRETFFRRPFEQRELAGGFGGELMPGERDYIARLNQQLESAALAATSTLRSFAAPPGRKVLLLLSGGWPLEPAIYALGSRTDPLLEPDLERGADLYRELADTANLLGYTLYPIDVPGFQGSSVDAADGSPPSLEADRQARLAPVTTVDGSTVPPPGEQFLNRQLREYSVHDTLKLLAAETGGRALVNSLRDRPLETAVADTRAYYWLGFSPRWQGDDERHEVRVELREPGFEARAREGFFDFSRQREVSMMVESALLFGNPPSSRPLLAEVGPPKRAGWRAMEVPLALAIPLDAVTLLPTGDGFAARMELRVAALDEDGRRSDVPVVPIVLSGAEEPPAGSYARYDTRLKLRRARQQLVVAVYDPPTGALLSTTVEVDPEAGSKADKNGRKEP